MKATEYIRGFRGLEVFTGIAERTLREIIPEELKIRPSRKILLFRRNEVIEHLEQFRVRPDRDLGELVDGVVAEVLRESR